MLTKAKSRNKSIMWYDKRTNYLLLKTNEIYASIKSTAIYLNSYILDNLGMYAWDDDIVDFEKVTASLNRKKGKVETYIFQFEMKYYFSDEEEIPC